MTAFLDTIRQYVLGFFASYNWIADTLDILLMAVFVFFIIRLVRDSRAEQFLRGIVVLVVLYIAAYFLELTTVMFMLNAVFDNGLILLIVVFQPEVRRALEQAGRSRKGLSRFFLGLGSVDNAAHIDQWKKAFRATADALEVLQKEKMGALIVMERNTRLGEIVRSGTLIEADPSAALISAIFYNKAPLHDGAMIIRDGKVYAAACILPLTDNLQISRELGTRHRAGVGMSENSDAIVVILSEETGMISVAEGGVLKRNFTPDTLVKTLEERILWSQEESGARRKLRKGRKRMKAENNTAETETVAQDVTESAEGEEQV